MRNDRYACLDGYGTSHKGATVPEPTRALTPVQRLAALVDQWRDRSPDDLVAEAAPAIRRMVAAMRAPGATTLDSGDKETVAAVLAVLRLQSRTPAGDVDYLGTSGPYRRLTRRMWDAGGADAGERKRLRVPVGYLITDYWRAALSTEELLSLGLSPVPTGVRRATPHREQRLVGRAVLRAERDPDPDDADPVRLLASALAMTRMVSADRVSEMARVDRAAVHAVARELEEAAYVLRVAGTD